MESSPLRRHPHDAQLQLAAGSTMIAARGADEAGWRTRGRELLLAVLGNASNPSELREAAARALASTV